MASNHNSFNRKLFSELIQRAKGKRTLTKYADDTKTSIAHISRMINEKLESPPSPETIKKLVPVEINGVTYKDLMMAAGHINQISFFEELDIKADSDLKDNPETDNSSNAVNCYSQVIEERRKFKSLCMSTILFTLSCNNLSWSIPNGYDKTKPYMHTNDFSLEIQDTYITAWTFELKYLSSSIKNESNPYGISPRYVIDTWGKLAFNTIPMNSKYTIVTDSEDLYNSFFKYAPKNLDINISIMLINTDELRVLREEYVSYYHSADKNELDELIIC